MTCYIGAPFSLYLKIKYERLLYQEKKNLEMYKLNRKVFKMQTFEEASDNCKYWLQKTPIERLEAAAYLNSAAYNYPFNNPPRLDRTYFKITHRK